jgi:hypothetical protein
MFDDLSPNREFEDKGGSADKNVWNAPRKFIFTTSRFRKS